MRKINNLTYLNLSEILVFIKNEAKNYNINHDFNEKDILLFLEKGIIKGIKIEGNWNVNKCDLNYFLYFYENIELESKVEYGGSIGVNLTDVELNGKILDIGGGGEGIIGQLKGNRVIAIDPSKRELEEAADGPIKIVMDAKNLMFLNNTFDTVTSFYTLMYIPNSFHKLVFEEIYRVLKPNGEFILWDVSIEDINKNKDICLFQLEIQLPYKTVFTGYGVNKRELNMDYYINLAKITGFNVTESCNISLNSFQLKFKK